MAARSALSSSLAISDANHWRSMIAQAKRVLGRPGRRHDVQLLGVGQSEFLGKVAQRRSQSPLLRSRSGNRIESHQIAEQVTRSGTK